MVGARDLDPPEIDNLKKSQVNRADVTDLGELRLDRPVHLYIDNDVIDADEVPANNFPVDDGPNLEETIAACINFVSHNNIVAVSLSGWNSTLDSDGRTAAACRQLMQAIAETQDLR